MSFERSPQFTDVGFVTPVTQYRFRNDGFGRYELNLMGAKRHAFCNAIQTPREQSGADRHGCHTWTLSDGCEDGFQRRLH